MEERTRKKRRKRKEIRIMIGKKGRENEKKKS